VVVESIREQAVGWARSAPSSEHWAKLCDALAGLHDADPDHAHALVDELEVLLSSWPDDLRAVNTGACSRLSRHSEWTCHHKWWIDAPAHPAIRLVRSLAIFMRGERGYRRDRSSFGVTDLLDNPLHTNLKSVTIAFESDPGYGADVLTLLATRDALARVTSVCFDNVLLYVEEMAALAGRSMPPRSMSIDGDYGDSDAVIAFLTHPSAAALERLEVGGTSVIRSFGRLGHLAALRRFSLHHGDRYIDEARWEQVGTALARCPLEVVDLSNNTLTDAKLERLLAAIPCTRLEVLDLSSNQLTDRGARFLAGLPKLARLESLTLHANAQISAAGFEALAGSPHLSPAVRQAFRKVPVDHLIERAATSLRVVPRWRGFAEVVSLLDEHHDLLSADDRSRLLASIEAVLDTWPDDERSAPQAWWMKVARGMPFAPFRLCRRVHVHADHTTIGNGVPEALVHSPMARHLRILEIDPLHDQWHDISAVGTSPHLVNLTTLKLNELGSRHGKACAFGFGGWSRARLPNLKSVHLTFCALTPTDVRQLVGGPVAGQLEHLELVVDGPCSAELGSIVAASTRLTRLKHLRLHVGGDLDGLGRSFDDAERFPCLETVELS